MLRLDCLWSLASGTRIVSSFRFLYRESKPSFIKKTLEVYYYCRYFCHGGIYLGPARRSWSYVWFLERHFTFYVWLNNFFRHCLIEIGLFHMIQSHSQRKITKSEWKILQVNPTGCKVQISLVYIWNIQKLKNLPKDCTKFIWKHSKLKNFE